MPIYEYEVLDQDGRPKGIYETMQKMSEPALTRHPITGEPVRRILSRTFVAVSDGAAESCASGACDMPSSGGCAGGSCGWD